MGPDGVVYKLLFLLHLLAVVVGFGSSFVYPAINSRTRDVDARARVTIGQAVYSMWQSLSFYPIVAAGIFGVALVVVSDKVYTFAEPWVSLAFLLFFGVVGVAFFLQRPNRAAMVELEDQLAGGGASGGAQAGAELDERVRKDAAFSGIQHLLWLLLMIDMIFKPGH